MKVQIATIVAECAEVSADRLSCSDSLHRLGVDSLASVNIAYEIGLLVGRDVPSVLITEHDTIDKLVDYVMGV